MKERRHISLAAAPSPAPARHAADSLDRHWHLARDEAEIQLAELEYALYRVQAAFDRWQAECVAATARKPLNSTENAMLHVIRMKDRPKTIAEVARLLNRDDQPNLQYAIRKLIKAGLIEKKPLKGKGVSYQVTAQGRAVSDEYAELRGLQLMPLVKSVHDWAAMIENTRRMLEMMKGIYDSAALAVAAHRPSLDDAE
jgi:predicted MarR family transcription regulator